jgi:hypothetical protein
VTIGPARIAALTVFATLGAAAPAAAITRAQANRAALSALAPQKQAGEVVVFGMSRPLKASDGLSQPSPPRASAHGIAKPARGKKVGRRGWLYWMDLHYRSGFAHPSVMLVVDDRSGRVALRRKLRYWPRINGRDAPFHRGKAYARLQGAVYRRLEPAEAFRPVAASAQAAQNAGIFEDDCIYTVGGASAPRSILNITGYLGTLGIESASPSPGDGRKYIHEGAIEHGLDALTKTCKDVILYLEGHGDGGSVLVDAAGSNGRPDDLWLNAGLVATMITSHPGTTFKLIVDSCASGVYVTEVRRLVDKAGTGNLLIELSSVTGDQASFAYVGTDGELKQAFTEGLIDGMKEVDRSVLERDGSGAPAGARLLEAAFGNRSRGTAENVFGRVPTMNSKLPAYVAGPPKGTGPPPVGSGRIERDCEAGYPTCGHLKGFVTFDRDFDDFYIILPSGWQGAGSEPRADGKGIGQCFWGTTNTYADTISCSISPQKAGTEVTFVWDGIYGSEGYKEYPSGMGADLYHTSPAAGPFRMSGP